MARGAEQRNLNCLGLEFMSPRKAARWARSPRSWTRKGNFTGFTATARLLHRKAASTSRASAQGVKKGGFPTRPTLDGGLGVYTARRVRLISLTPLGLLPGKQAQDPRGLVITGTPELPVQQTHALPPEGSRLLFAASPVRFPGPSTAAATFQNNRIEASGKRSPPNVRPNRTKLLANGK